MSGTYNPLARAVHRNVRRMGMASRRRYLQLADWDRKFLWHPFTQMREWEKEDPLIITRAKGAWLYDASGRKYLDGVSSIWLTVHGHRQDRKSVV